MFKIVQSIHHIRYFARKACKSRSRVLNLRGSGLPQLPLSFEFGVEWFGSRFMGWAGIGAENRAREDLKASKCGEFRGFPCSLKRWICSEKSALCIHANNSIWSMQGGILPLTPALWPYWRVQAEESNPFQTFYFAPHSTTRVKSRVESMLHVLLTT